jgi:hypothetical protein
MLDHDGELDDDQAVGELESMRRISRMRGESWSKVLFQTSLALQCSRVSPSHPHSTLFSLLCLCCTAVKISFAVAVSLLDIALRPRIHLKTLL